MEALVLMARLHRNPGVQEPHMQLREAAALKLAALNPNPLNPKPQTLNSKLTLNPNPRPSTLSPKP